MVLVLELVFRGRSLARIVCGSFLSESLSLT